jgi:DNA-binding NtrC family response regulator
VVDDDELIVRSYARVLSRAAEVLTAHSVEEARELLKTRSIQLLLTDFECGEELMRHVRDVQPRARRVLMTASSSERVMQFVNDGLAHELVEKPAHIDELLQLVSRLAS